ncbi:lipopolysaccharide transport periplasmic protein LptA [Candidatus Curculioniphilus buchneri]|uniref:lipopolysaccharide transport periplasmic protein LptA n=1 Tax=Candidatus Curculioniphilus buchneri TaxID=690594 RepID=UPI00376EFA31
MQVKAFTNDNRQYIYISATQQSVDLTTKTMTLIGTVVVKYGSIDIRANKAIAYFNEKDSYKVVEGYGDPVKFFQFQENGKLLQGHASKVRYEFLNDLLMLTGKACIEQLDSKVKGDRIIYHVKKNKIEVLSDTNKQVTAILAPVQFQDEFIKKTSINPIK